MLLNPTRRGLPSSHSAYGFAYAVSKLAANTFLVVANAKMSTTGNTRMVLTDEQQVNAYPPASMETANATTENSFTPT